MNNDSHDPDTEMLRLEGVYKNYNNFKALHPVDIVINSGEFVSILGPSGSGKTTLLNIICGMTAATGGTVRIGGRDVTRMPAKKRNIGMVFQNYALMPHLNVAENIAFPLEVRRQSRAQIAARVAEVLQTVRLPGFEHRKISELSGGQQQRIAIARCLAYRPDLILMDEPLGALDRNLREQMQGEIGRLSRDLGITVVYVTHDQGEAINMSDRILLMNKGAIAQSGRPQDLYLNPVSRFVATFMGQSSFIPAVVETSGPEGAVSLPGGHRLPVDVGPSANGAAGAIMIRPEAVIFDEGGALADLPSIPANILSSTFKPGYLEYTILLEGGTRVIGIQLGNRHTIALGPSRIGWRPSDVRFFPD